MTREEMQYDHKETQNDYKETQNNYKETQNDYKETQNDYNSHVVCSRFVLLSVWVSCYM